MKIAFLPFVTHCNAYVRLQEKALQDLGHDVVPFQINVEADVACFNWYESFYTKSLFHIIKQYLFKKLSIGYLKMKGIKVVCFFHNKISHDATKAQAIASRRLMKYLYEKADAIVVLNDDSKRHLKEYVKKDVSNKVFIIPHINYIGAYSDQTEYSEYPFSNFRVLFTGVVKPYKNVEKILQAADKLKEYDIHFYINGMAKDKEYGRQIMEIAEGMQNVTVNLECVPNEKIDEVIRSACVQVFPYDIRSSMNSGSIIHAFSNGRTVIAPCISMLTDFPKDLYYSYEYNSDSEHTEELEKQILSAYNDWKKDRDAFFEKGKKLYEIVETQNSMTVVRQAYEAMLNKL